jgi:tetratricopeptide (TPR) repeat protein
MKKYFILGILMCSLSAHSQNVKNPEFLKMDSVATSYYKGEQYASALNTYGELQKLLKANLTEGDSLIIDNYVKQARCYYRLKMFDKSVETAKNVVELHKKYHSTEDKLYAFYLDNLSLYQGSANDYENALKNSQEAEAVYQKLGYNDSHLAFIQLHISEDQAALGKYTDAISTELRALSLLGEIYGVHSDYYINEAPYLVKYYTAAGMMDEAEKLETKIKELKKEKEDGIEDIPAEINFETAEQTKEHKWEVLRCANYILEHYPYASQMENALKYMFTWITKTDMLNMSLGSVEAKLADKNSSLLLMAYMASCINYAFNEERFNMDVYMFGSALGTVLNYYQACLEKKCLKKNKFCEKLIDDFKKGNIDASINKLWAEKEREMNISTGAAVISSNF